MTVATSLEDLMTTFPQDLVPAPPRAAPRVPVKLPVELPVAADRHAPLPLTGQIAAQLREALAAGRLAAGERLPSTRALAAALGVSRTVVTAAYTQLFAEGWLEGRHGSGTYVAPGAAGPRPPATARAVPSGAAWVQPDGPALVCLRPGIPWQAGIDPAAWRRAWRHAGTEPVPAQPDPRGRAALREALTGYLRRSRGISAANSNSSSRPEIVTPGPIQP